MQERLQSRQEHDHQAAHTTKAQTEFAGPEELLRFDAAQTKVPENIPRRLQESLRGQPRPKISWWRRLFRS